MLFCSLILFLRSFDPRRECVLRKYSYLLPADVIGIKSNFSTDDIDFHVSDFNQILNAFEVLYLFVSLLFLSCSEASVVLISARVFRSILFKFVMNAVG